MKIAAPAVRKRQPTTKSHYYALPLPPNEQANLVMEDCIRATH